MIIGPGFRVTLVAPWRRVMVMVPVTPSGAQTISNGDPAGIVASKVGEDIESKNCATVEAAIAKMAAKTKE